ncbi:MAG: hypothetical protein WCO94_12725 [Verrucomicrobiota bacterium]
MSVPEESEEQFLARYDGKWFQPEIKRLLRLENEWDEAGGFDVDRMPFWAARMFGKTASVFDLKPTSPEMTDEKQFGKMLGGKVAGAVVGLEFLKQMEKGPDTARVKLAGLYNLLKRQFLTSKERRQFKDSTPRQIILELRKEKPRAEKIRAIRKKTMSRVQSESLARQGRFFEGYGTGLLLPERTRDWIRNSSKRSQSTAYANAFAFLNWQHIEECSKNGKWAELLEDFTTSLPDGVDISEEAFQQALRRVGIGPFGKPGRPAKTLTTI